MTLEELQAMSDEELNELAAVKVMGLNYHNTFGMWMGNGVSYIKWNPTGDMNDAMELLEQFDTYQITKSKTGFSHSELAYRVIVGKNQNVAYSDSKTRAITIASILAKE